MRITKKILATVMCLALLISGNSYVAYAADTEDRTVEITESDGDTANDTILPEETGTESTVSGESTSDDTALSETTSASEDESTADVQISGDDIDTDLQNDENSQILLNYVVVGNSYIETPDIQYVLMDAGDETTVIDSALVHITKRNSDISYDVEADIIDGTTMLFTMEYDDTMSGIYDVEYVEITSGEDVCRIDMETAGIEACYGVDEQIDTNPDAIIYDGETEEDEGLVSVSIEDPLTGEKIEDSISDSPATYDLMNLEGGNGGPIVIALDAGHGGSDPGTTRVYNGVTYSEAYMTLKIVLACKEELEKYDNIKVVLTRTPESDAAGKDWDSSSRVAAAVNQGADYIVSFHINATGTMYGGTANGSSIYYPNAGYRPDFNEQGKLLSDSILAKLQELGLKNNGAKIWNTQNPSDPENIYPDGSYGDYLGIIKRAKLSGVPAILIEHAFINNEHDFYNYLSTDEQLKKVGIADALGIADYINLQYGDGTAYYKGVDYSAVYDYEYYLTTYPDLMAAFGGKSPKLALTHFIENGMAEGRRGNAEFDVYSYKNSYADLRQAFGSDLKQYYLHYITCGKNEGRTDISGITEIKNPVASYNGVDYSKVYNYKYYTQNNRDLPSECYGDDFAAIKHFVEQGMAQGKRASDKFDVYSYRNAYGDLRVAFGADLKQYYYHYITSGYNEKRVATGVTELQNPVKSYNGVDYSRVYDYYYYITKYPDIKNAFNGDDVQTLLHFINCGMNEGRQGSDKFDVFSYKNAYGDLRSAFGTDLKQYYYHYISNGYAEKRVCTGVTELLNPTTIYAGVDYSKVYDYNYYVNKYPDIRNKFKGDENLVIQHFVLTGMDQGLQGSSKFDVNSYRNAYADLRQAFGKNLRQYYIHYLNDGYREKRVATGVTELQNPTTVYNGTDYSAVYDYKYYIAHNPDVKAAYNGDENDTLAHFVNNGMNEGRQASEKFNVSYYKHNYYDLQRAFGDKLKWYYLHYMSDGCSEKRVADKMIDPVGDPYDYSALHSIMGSGNTSVNQMVAYYKANATYPSYYATSDAPNIETFCQIYYDECIAEGIKPEVAFCQAMLETGFLRFGGQVNISQFNFAGLGATDNGAQGASFPTVREGIRAHIQHLKAYASSEPLVNPCVDPRFSLVKRGSAKYVEWLGQQENPEGKGWATAKDYGYNIVRLYMAKLAAY